MKIRFIIFSGFLFLFLNARCIAQPLLLDVNRKVEVSGLVGWFITGNNLNPKIKNAPIYSLSAAYIRNPQVMYELNINSVFSKMKYDAYQGHGDTAINYSQTYIMLGIVRTFTVEIPNFMPYMSVHMGLSNMSLHAPGNVPQTKFAAGFLGGIKVALNERMGLKFQARVQAPLTGVGLGVGVSTGGPTVGIGSYSSGVQFDVSAGMFFRL